MTKKPHSSLPASPAPAPVPAPAKAPAPATPSAPPPAPAPLSAADTPQPVPLPTPPVPIGRIPVVDVAPTVENGRWATKAVVGEVVPIRATVFREGHDAVNASLVLTRPDGTVASRTTMTCVNPGLNLWVGEIAPDAEGEWTFHVEGWSDPWGTWRHDAEIKVPAGIDAELHAARGRAPARPRSHPRHRQRQRRGRRHLRRRGRHPARDRAPAAHPPRHGPRPGRHEGARG